MVYHYPSGAMNLAPDSHSWEHGSLSLSQSLLYELYHHGAIVLT
jgi:hypothetical protein